MDSFIELVQAWVIVLLWFAAVCAYIACWIAFTIPMLVLHVLYLCFFRGPDSPQEQQ